MPLQRFGSQQTATCRSDQKLVLTALSQSPACSQDLLARPDPKLEAQKKEAEAAKQRAADMEAEVGPSSIAIVIHCAGGVFQTHC